MFNVDLVLYFSNLTKNDQTGEKQCSVFNLFSEEEVRSQAPFLLHNSAQSNIAHDTSYMDMSVVYLSPRLSSHRIYSRQPVLLLWMARLPINILTSFTAVHTACLYPSISSDIFDLSISID